MLCWVNHLLLWCQSSITDPLIVRRLITLLCNDSVSDNWILQAVYNLKEEWMQ